MIVKSKTRYRIAYIPVETSFVWIHYRNWIEEEKCQISTKFDKSVKAGQNCLKNAVVSTSAMVQTAFAWLDW